MAHAEPSLPSRIRAERRRAFRWHKRWARWLDQMRYCSAACRERRRA